MRKRIVAGNWKMNLDYPEAKALLKELIRLETLFNPECDVIICPSGPYLSVFCELLNDHKKINVGAQNCYYAGEGAFTGETGVNQLRSLGIRYCIVGHSERRSLFHETYTDLNKKVKALLTAGMIPIFCCGEQLQVRESNVHKEFVLNQVAASLFQFTADEISRIVIAYEPIWAIGTGKTASAEEAQEMHLLLRTRIGAQYGADIAGGIPIIYGGSLNDENAKNLFAQPDIDGGLIGGASLQAEKFVAVSNSF